ncbi:hypothetical protein LP418_25185 [Nocardioides sp. B-3]|nr:hypothetical protein [Nocardioides sp. B-3]UUZ59178.1 hypothetical protein LP418_25185 [Nocardioides sp. B-3]
MKLAHGRLAAALLAGLISVAVAPVIAAPANAEVWAVPRTSSTAITTTQSDFASFEDEVMIGINRARRSAGLREIKYYDSCVDRLAEEWGTRIAATGRFAHRDQRHVLKRCRQNWVGECPVQGHVPHPGNHRAGMAGLPGTPADPAEAPRHADGDLHHD